MSDPSNAGMDRAPSRTGTTTLISGGVTAGYGARRVKTNAWFSKASRPRHEPAFS